MDHTEIIRLVIAYTFLGAIVFTVIVTCASLIGWIKLQDTRQQQKLFYVLIIELIIGSVALFFNFLQVNPYEVQETITDQAIASAYVEEAPPYYGPGVNVRPQMEAYIDSFPLPTCSERAVKERDNLLSMIEQRAVSDPPGHFEADNDFRAALETFRRRVRAYSISGEWPDDF